MLLFTTTLRSFWLAAILPFVFCIPTENPISPLQITLQRSGIEGNIRALITNRGSAAAYFSTWQNPLSIDDLARKVDVTTAGANFTLFLNPEGFVPGDFRSKSYELLIAGGSVIREIDIASNYDVQPGKEYYVQAGGSVPYYIEGKAETILDATYESNTLPLVLQSMPVRQADMMSNYILGTCENAVLKKKIETSIPIALDMAKKASAAAASGTNSAAFVAYFKSDTPENRKKVSERFAAMAKHLSAPGEGPTRLTCLTSCTGYMANGAAWTGVSGGLTQFCPPVCTPIRQL
jgi:hypothetical protein